jgi:xylan 1,4-beta-xylosidase
VHRATTWSFYFEGERLFEGTRSLFTAGEIDKPVLNAYRMLSRLGDTRLAATSTHAWPLDRLDGENTAMPEEVDVLAAAHGRDSVQVLVWRHADDQYATDGRESAVTVDLERLPFGGEVRVEHTRIDARHSNSHSAWQALGRPSDPTASELAAIKERQGLEAAEPVRRERVHDGALTVHLSLPLPGVSLLEIRPAG